MSDRVNEAAFQDAGLRTAVTDSMEWLDILYRHLDPHWQDTFRESYGGVIERLTRDLIANEALATERATGAVDVERVGEAGWLHPEQCSNAHNEHGNCLNADGTLVGWREWTEYARLSGESE